MLDLMYLKPEQKNKLPSKDRSFVDLVASLGEQFNSKIATVHDAGQTRSTKTLERGRNSRQVNNLEEEDIKDNPRLVAVLQENDSSRNRNINPNFDGVGGRRTPSKTDFKMLNKTKHRDSTLTKSSLKKQSSLRLFGTPSKCSNYKNSSKKIFENYEEKGQNNSNDSGLENNCQKQQEAYQDTRMRSSSSQQNKQYSIIGDEDSRLPSTTSQKSPLQRKFRASEKIKNPRRSANSRFTQPKRSQTFKKEDFVYSIHDPSNMKRDTSLRENLQVNRTPLFIDDVHDDNINILSKENQNYQYELQQEQQIDDFNDQQKKITQGEKEELSPKNDIQEIEHRNAYYSNSMIEINNQEAYDLDYREIDEQGVNSNHILDIKMGIDSLENNSLRQFEEELDPVVEFTDSSIHNSRSQILESGLNNSSLNNISQGGGGGDEYSRGVILQEPCQETSITNSTMTNNFERMTIQEEESQKTLMSSDFPNRCRNISQRSIPVDKRLTFNPEEKSEGLRIKGEGAPPLSLNRSAVHQNKTLLGNQDHIQYDSHQLNGSNIHKLDEKQNSFPINLQDISKNENSAKKDLNITKNEENKQEHEENYDFEIDIEAMKKRREEYDKAKLRYQNNMKRIKNGSQKNIDNTKQSSKFSKKKEASQIESGQESPLIRKPSNSMNSGQIRESKLSNNEVISSMEVQTDEGHFQNLKFQSIPKNRAAGKDPQEKNQAVLNSEVLLPSMMISSSHQSQLVINDQQYTSNLIEDKEQTFKYSSVTQEGLILEESTSNCKYFSTYQLLGSFTSFFGASNLSYSQQD